jgi:Papain-like cysteine protease AvrRpt2
MASEDGGNARLQTMEFPRIVVKRSANRLSGMETLDLSAAEPEPTVHLTLGDDNRARFQRKSKETPQGSAWRIGGEGDELELALTLPYKHGVNLILELCRTESTPGEGALATLAINEQPEWELELDPHNLNFHRQAWYVPHYMLEKGKNRIRLKLAPEAGAAVLLRSASVMRFDLQPQKKDNWCWAAVTASLINFFADGDPMQQEQVVRNCLDPDEVREKGDDLTLVLPKALDEMGLRSMRCNYPISLDEIRKQVQLGLPVAIRIEWKGGGGHFVVITGVLPQHPKGDGHTWLRVADPKLTDEKKELTVPLYITYRALTSKRYRTNGEWTHTYLFEKHRER